MITTWARVKPGTTGAISSEGYLAGVIGGLLISLLAAFIGFIELKSVSICTAAAVIASTIESYIGATWSNGNIKWLTHDVVNVANTLFGAITSVFIYRVYNYIVSLI